MADILLLVGLYVAGLVVVSIITLYLCIKLLLEESKEPGGRFFGFNCDRCSGKRKENGSLYLRCRIKPKILVGIKRLLKKA